jgi:hypothetical protein
LHIFTKRHNDVRMGRAVVRVVRDLRIDRC